MKTTRLALFAAFCALISGGGVEAETFTWTGAANDGNKWSTPGNWENNAAPSAATDVALFDIAEDATTDFNIDFSPIIQKRGTGKLTLSGNTYNNTASTGSVFLYGGSLDLGGGTATMVQPSREASPVIEGGTGLYNAIVKYTGVAKNAGIYKQDYGYLTFTEGVVFIGSGAKFTMDCGLMPYGSEMESGTGARTVLVDGGSLVMNGNSYVIGVDGDWEKAARLHIKNGNATFSGNFIVGARFGSVSSVGAAGIVTVEDSTVDGNYQLLISNENDRGTGCRAIVALTNSTLITTRPNVPAVALNNFKRPKSDVHLILHNSTIDSRELQLHAMAYTGSAELEGREAKGKKWTGLMTLDRGTLKPKAATAQFIYNNNTATDPCVELLSGGGTIDTAYNITIPAVAFGEGGWTKKGSGTLTLSGANLYTGDTKCEEGELNLTGTISGGIAAIGGTIKTTQTGMIPSLRMDGGTAQFSGLEPCSFEKVEIGANGGVIFLGVKGFVFNGVSGADNLSALTLSASPSGWGTGEVIFSDSPEFLTWAVEQLNGLLPGGFSASVSGTSVVVDSDVEIKTTTWTGNGADSSWATAENWDAGTPGPADTVILGGTAKTDTMLDAELAPNTITFAENAGAFTVSGDGSLSVTAGITNLSENAQTFNIPVTLAGASGILHTKGDVSFAGGLSASGFVKDGSGTVFLHRSHEGVLDIKEGGVKLVQPDGGESVVLSSVAGSVHIGGTLDLGNGAFDIRQPDSDDFVLSNGAVLKNGSFNYSSGKLVYEGSTLSETALMWREGTVTVGAGATLTHSSVLIPYAKSAPSDSFGKRRLFVDGGTVKVTTGKYINIIGVDKDWDKDFILEVANNGSFSSSGGIVVGSRNNGNNGTSYEAKGSLIVRDGGSVTVGGKITIVNASSGGGSYGVVAVTNGTIKCTNNDGICLFGYPYAQNTSSQCDARLVMDGGVVEAWHVVACAMPGTGIMAGRATGTIHLGNGATIRALGNDRKGASNTFTKTEFLFNGVNDSTYPAVELLSGGGVIDSQSYTVTASAVMYGEGGLTKKGTGTLTLSGDNLYEGGTVVEEGTLNVTGSVKGGVVVKSGGTLSCASDAVFESVTIEKGGKVAEPEEYEGEWAEILRTTGELTVLDDMATNGLRLFVRRSNGQNVLCWGKRPGFMVILY